MPKVVISDTSILILFKKIDEFNLLFNVYKEIIITEEVADEFGEELPEWIIIKPIFNIKYIELLETQVDKGEASSLALASEMRDVLILIDDLKARKLAKQINFKITGTLGIIHKAKKMGIIDKVKPILNKILETNFRISQNIIDEILFLNNE